MKKLVLKARVDISKEEVVEWDQRYLGATSYKSRIRSGNQERLMNIKKLEQEMNFP